MTTTQTEFFQQHAVNGVLPDELMTQMLALPAGDISLVFDEGSSGSPTADEGNDDDDDKELNPDGTPKVTAAAPAPTPAPAPAAAAPAPTPAPAAPAPQVILAKDGVHTIPFERLEEARELARQAKERADALAAENERLKAAGQASAPSPAQAPSPSPTPAPAPAAEGEAGLFGDYSDTAIAAGVEKLIAARTATLQQELAALRQQLTPVQEAAQLEANEAHWRTIYTAHPDLDSLVDSTEVKNWIDKQPAFARAAYEKVLDEGAAPEVVELFNAYKDANGIARAGTTQPPAAPPAGAPAPAPAASPAAAAAAQAAAAIAAAAHVPPTSLSELPAGSSAHHDEAAAMLEMSPVALMTKLEGKTPEQINALMNKFL